jgi:hypothetical protein
MTKKRDGSPNNSMRKNGRKPFDFDSVTIRFESATFFPDKWMCLVYTVQYTQIVAPKTCRNPVDSRLAAFLLMISGCRENRRDRKSKRATLGQAAASFPAAERSALYRWPE